MTLRGPQKVSLLMGVNIKEVEYRGNVRAFFPQVQNKLSVIMRHPY